MKVFSLSKKSCKNILSMKNMFYSSIVFLILMSASLASCAVVNGYWEQVYCNLPAFGWEITYSCSILIVLIAILTVSFEIWDWIKFIILATKDKRVRAVSSHPRIFSLWIYLIFGLLPGIYMLMNTLTLCGYSFANGDGVIVRDDIITNALLFFENTALILFGAIFISVLMKTIMVYVLQHKRKPNKK